MLPWHEPEEPMQSAVGFTYTASFAVKIFFFISGMLVMNSLLVRRSIPAFLISRFFRIIPALLLVLLATSFIIGPIVTTLPLKTYFSDPEVYTYILRNVSFNTRYFLPGVFETNPWSKFVNSSLWTLRIEVKCYLLLLLYYFAVGPRKVFFNVFILLVIIDAIFQLRYIGVGLTTDLNLLPFSFALGMFAAVNKDVVFVNIWVLLASVALTVVLWCIPHVNEMMLILSTSILVLVLSGNEYVRKIRIKHDISYGIYVWGFLVQQTVVYCMGRHQNLYVHMALSVTFACIMGLISYLLVEHRAMDLGKKLNSRFKGKTSKSILDMLPFGRK